ncbi:signal peptidase II [Alphaproteobacteria bacterium]|nr:signal peptidase II [Alphaproteobacteria bacterium]
MPANRYVLKKPNQTQFALPQALALAAVLAGIDQTSKWLIVFGLNFQTGEPHALLPFLDLRLLWNPGISYGMLDSSSELGRWLLFSLASVITLGFLWAMRTAPNKIVRLAYAMIIGGALGNLVDRGLHGAVVDFISLHSDGYYWYVFNLADIWITLGVLLLIFDVFRDDKDTA